LIINVILLLISKIIHEFILQPSTDSVHQGYIN